MMSFAHGWINVFIIVTTLYPFRQLSWNLFHLPKQMLVAYAARPLTSQMIALITLVYHSGMETFESLYQTALSDGDSATWGTKVLVGFGEAWQRHKHCTDNADKLFTAGPHKSIISRELQNWEHAGIKSDKSKKSASKTRKKTRKLYAVSGIQENLYWHAVGISVCVGWSPWLSDNSKASILVAVAATTPVHATSYQKISKNCNFKNVEIDEMLARNITKPK